MELATYPLPEENRISNPLTSRQYDSTVLLDKNRENFQSQIIVISQWILGLSVSQSNSCHSRVLAKQSEYLGRLAIQKLQGFKRLEIESQIFSQNVKIREIPPVDLIPSRLNSDPGSFA